jgi:hypothetical protein
MNKALLTRVVITSLLALNLNFVGASQAQAACSDFDRRAWEGYWKVEPDEELGIEGVVGARGVYGYYLLTSVFGGRENEREVLKLTKTWKDKTKNKKLKSKITKFERLLKKYIPQPAALGDYQEMDFAFNDLDYTLENNLC